MRKLLLSFAFLVGMATVSMADNAYTVNEEKIDAAFTAAQEVNYTDAVSLASINLLGVTADETTKTGFLVRAFFCGEFALHRSYMGTKGLFVKYFCTLGVVGCIDFWWVVFKGDEAFNKFKGNDKWFVWNDDKGDDKKKN